MSNNPLNTARHDVWILKEIEWQPYPDLPKRRVKIVMQTRNGPCSFIALCNILILRGDIEILPRERREAAYEFLSNLVGDYLLRASPDTDITSVLSILPMTQNGLDLNPLFTGAFSFRPSGDGAALKLFEQTNIRLVHGWLCDPDSFEYGSISKTQDYDSSIDLVVEADSLTKGQLVGGWESPPESAYTSTPDTVALSTEQQQKVENAVAVRRFLDASQSQITYYGLFTLTFSIQPGELVALFRNSHLAVLYKPHGKDAGLYSLVTDHTFAFEEAVVWEKLDDIEGSSQFVDADFRAAAPIGGDFAGETAESVARAHDRNNLSPEEIQDRELARVLQAEEDQRAQSVYYEQLRRQQQRQANNQQPSRPLQPLRPGYEQQPQDGNATEDLLAKKRKKKGGCTIM